ncbi:MAG: HAD-IIB family hydrolase [Polyangiaceae bacterium]|nr:HAD-IIB family hydrolase [Polyangiaceae bacterium]
MRPLSALGATEASRLRGVVFDLDDTLLTHGELTLEAYRALFRLRDAGLRLYACTGRPAGWAAVVARQWPVDACLAENGAIAFARAGRGVERLLRLSEPERLAERARLCALARELEAAHPELVPTDDAFMRLCDVTYDIGERASVPATVLAAVRRDAGALGLRTYASTIHLHLTLSGDDKASGTLWLLARRHGEDSTGALARYAFVGDSENDAPCFAAFHTTIGVANVVASARRLSVPPRYLAPAAMGAGFAAIADHLAAERLRPALGGAA